MPATLLHYRAWTGDFRPAWHSIWPVARVALSSLLRRRLFWTLYALSLLIFFMFFFGNFMLGWAESIIGDKPLKVGKIDIPAEKANVFIRQRLRILSGSQETFSYFFAYQGTMAMVVLALTGAVVVGNDRQYRSLPFYLSKPIERWHYLMGKMLAVNIVVHLLTTVPALVLYLQNVFNDFGYLTDVDYFVKSAPLPVPGQPNPPPGPAGWLLLLGILGYGMILSVFLSILLVATALWQTRTVALAAVWTSLFVFLRRLSLTLVDDLRESELWRFLDVWNTIGLLGQGCLGYAHDQIRPTPQPEFWEAGLFLVGVSILCAIYLSRKTRSIEVVRS